MASNEKELMLHNCFLYEFTLQIIHGSARTQKYLQFCLCRFHSRVRTFEVCASMSHYTRHYADNLHFLANKSAELAVSQFCMHLCNFVCIYVNCVIAVAFS